MEKHMYLERINNLKNALSNSDFDIAIIVDKVNMLYFCGTMQDGAFVIDKNGNYTLFARRSFERAKMESPLENILPMNSYREVFAVYSNAKTVYMEVESTTLAMLERIKKYSSIEKILPLEKIILNIRAIKSDYEVECIRKSGVLVNQILEKIVPCILQKGIDNELNEADFCAEIYANMVGLGHQGITRFSMFQTNMLIGQIAFGTNSLVPSSFDGPGGMKGMSAASPFIGDNLRKLKKGDLVFVDIGFGINGYHTDRTQVYSMGKQPDFVYDIHAKCLEIQQKTATLLQVGNIPQQIYREILSTIPSDFLPNFMGYNGRNVKFLGHGVGLHIDEYPVIANGFADPLLENMIIAIEPKYGIKDVGVVGVEDTYLVTKGKAECLTFGEKMIIEI